MKFNPIISQILRHKWAIDPQYAFQQMPVIDNLLNGYMLDRDSIETNIPSALSSNNKVVTYYQWDDAPKDSIALINIKGELMKSSQYCGPVGMETLGRRIKEADGDPRFAGIMLVIDSPGGTVDGTEVFASLIKNTKKPVLAFVDGLMASAAAWIGSAADEIWASTDTDEIGSIGVLMSFWDVIPAYEREGFKFHLLTASTSSDKVKLFEDLRAGNYKEYQESVLDVLDQKFMNTIRENRPAVSKEHLTGKVFFAKDVLGVLVDKIGSFEQAVERIYTMSYNNPGSSGVSIGNENDSKELTINAINKMDKLILLMAAMGVSSLESDDGHVSLSEEQLNSIEAALQKANNTAADFSVANNSLREENNSLKQAASGYSAPAISKADLNQHVKVDNLEAIVSASDDFETGLNKIHKELND